MPRLTPLVRNLLLAWAGVWLLNFLLRGAGSQGPLNNFLDLDPALLGGDWRQLPGLIGYTFAHDGLSLWHLLFNAYLLAVFGPEVEILYPRFQFGKLFLVTTLVGAAAHLLLSLMVPGLAPAIGGSGFVTAVIAVNAAVYPNRILNLIFIRLRMITFFLILVGLDLLVCISTAKGEMSGKAFEIHLAGALVGWFWADGFGRMGIQTPWQAWGQRRRQNKNQRQQQQSRDEEAELDRILAKISREGLPSLTPKERRFLDRRSKQKRSS